MFLLFSCQILRIPCFEVPNPSRLGEGTMSYIGLMEGF